MNYFSVAGEIFRAGVERVLPDSLIRKSLSVEGGVLGLNDLRFDLSAFNRIFVIGAGKASALMAAEVEKILGDRITGGHIIVKHEHGCKLDKIKLTEAGHPVPDLNGFMAAAEILQLCSNATENDLVLCLISGGGSALLPDYPAGSSPGEIMELNDLLVKSGAAIGEINAVRKHLSSIKGGQLAAAAFPATMLTLVLSDVVGDPLDVIASGPTVPDTSSFKDALDILEKYALTAKTPKSLLACLEEGREGKRPETPRQGSRVFEKSFTVIIGNNRLALEAAAGKASSLGFTASIISDTLKCDLSRVAEEIIETALRYRHDKAAKKPAALLFGGEPTIKVTGNGLGGRNQHLALLCSLMLKGSEGITLLSAGTDGNDGPTGAAGAVVDSFTAARAIESGADPAHYLDSFDSFNFFRNNGGHIITGPTMTNVMDIVVILVL